jgi:copper(I)-binding protein
MIFWLRILSQSLSAPSVLAHHPQRVKQSGVFGSLMMMNAMRLLASGAAWGLLLACVGPVAAAQPVSVREAWVRAPAPGQTIAGAYMELTAPAKSALVSVASPIAARGELHSTTMEGGVMKMRSTERIELAAGKTVKLEPGGFHVMLIDLKRTLKPGEKIPLTVTVEGADAKRSTVSVQAEVRGADGSAMHHH